MPELAPIAVVGWSAVGVLVLVWLVVSFQKPGASRSRTAWLGAIALYVALGSLFVHLFLRAREGGSTVGTIAFGFLVALFASGLAVSVWRTVASLRAGEAKGGHATH